MADIFISYAREDLERVMPIVEKLKINGWSVFWDRNLLPGSRWAIEITKELDESRCVLVVWSSASINSEKHHWVREEAETGRERGILVPLRLDVVVLPLGFRSIQAADLSNWKKNSDDPEFRQLIAAITDIIPPPQKTSPKPPLPSVVPAPGLEPRATAIPAKGESAVRQKSAATSLKIGDEYDGGKIAWLDATGQHGLIAAKSDLPSRYSWEDAKKACHDYKENGYSDWYLPTKDELNKLYYAKSAVGGFSDFIYWSSTEVSAPDAWSQYFSNGFQYDIIKYYKWCVRAVRAF